MQSFLKAKTDDSMMRLMAIRAVNTACFVAIFSIVGSTLCVICGIVLSKDINTLTGVIGGILGGSAALVGTLLGPAFIGKAAQSFSENKPDKGEVK